MLLPHQVERLYPVEEIYSQEGEKLGRIAYTELYFAALGFLITVTARVFRSAVWALLAAPFLHRSVQRRRKAQI